MKNPFANLFRRQPAAAPAPAAAEPPAPESLPSETDLLAKVRSWKDAMPPADEFSRTMKDFTRMVRSYEAGAVSDYNQDFKGTFGSANSEILPGKYSIRARTRTLAKDTPQGKVVVRTFQNNVVGANPFKLDMRVGKYVTKPGDNGKTHKIFEEETETNLAIERFWRWFGQQENFTVRKTMSFMESGRVVEGSLIREGSILCRLHRDYPFNEIRFAVDFLEEDRLQEQYGGKSGPDSAFGPNNPIRGSIEYHPRYNFPLAYWVLTRHPGEYYSQASAWSPGQKNLFREQIPAADLIHINNLRDRAEQDSGMTELDAAVQPIWRNNQFTKALTLCAIASHIRAFVLEKKLPTGLQLPVEQQEMMQNLMANYAGGIGAAGGGDPAKSQQGATRPVQVFQPGQERELPYGVEAKVLAPEFPSEPAHEFRLDNAREVAIATGVSYQHASGDFQNLGFIAGLMCQIPFQDWCKIRQEHLKEGWLFRLFREALRAAILSGWFEKRGINNISILRLDEYVECADFKAKRWAFVNPLVQAQTLILLMQNHIMSPQQVQDELPNGVSIEDLYTMIGEAQNERAKHEIVSAEDPALTRPNVNEPDATKDKPEDGAPPAKSKTANPVRMHPRLQVDSAALLAMSTNGQH